LTNGYWLYLNL